VGFVSRICGGRYFFDVCDREWRSYAVDMGRRRETPPPPTGPPHRCSEAGCIGFLVDLVDCARLGSGESGMFPRLTVSDGRDSA
jgi:hypothetical protein